MNNNQDYLKIYIRNSLGKGQLLSVYKKINLQELKEQISKKIRKNKQLFSLYFQGNLLEDYQLSIQSYGMENNSIIHIQSNIENILKENSIYIKIRINNKNYSWQLSSKSLVIDIKNKIAQEFGFKQQNICLCHLGKEMNNQKTLKQSGIIQDTWVSIKSFNQDIFLENLDNSFRLVQSVDYPDSPPVSYNPWIKKSGGYQNNQEFVIQTINIQGVQLTNSRYAQSECYQKDKWQGKCLLSIYNDDKSRIYTIDCQGGYKVNKLIELLSRNEQIKPNNIELMNPYTKKVIEITQSMTVNEFPWESLIEKRILHTEIIYNILI